MRNKFGAVALSLLLAAVLYAAEHGGMNQAVVALKGDAAAAMRMGVHGTLTAAIAPDQPVQSHHEKRPDGVSCSACTAGRMLRF